MEKNMAGKNPMHLGDKHPFQKSGRTPKPKTATSRAAHPNAAGVQGAFRSANASMKGR